jgi:hypothetical protein
LFENEKLVPNTLFLFINGNLDVFPILVLEGEAGHEHPDPPVVLCWRKDQLKADLKS